MIGWVRDLAGEAQRAFVAAFRRHYAGPMPFLEDLERADLRPDGVSRVTSPVESTVEVAPEGDPGMEAVLNWFRNGGC